MKKIALALQVSIVSTIVFIVTSVVLSNVTANVDSELLRILFGISKFMLVISGIFTVSTSLLALLVTYFTQKKEVRVLIVADVKSLANPAFAYASYLEQQGFKVGIHSNFDHIVEFTPDVMVVLCETLAQITAFERLTNKPITLWIRINTGLLQPIESKPLQKDTSAVRLYIEVKELLPI